MFSRRTFILGLCTVVLGAMRTRTSNKGFAMSTAVVAPTVCMMMMLCLVLCIYNSWQWEAVWRSLWYYRMVVCLKAEIHTAVTVTVSATNTQTHPHTPQSVYCWYCFSTTAPPTYFFSQALPLSTIVDSWSLTIYALRNTNNILEVSSASILSIDHYNKPFVTARKLTYLTWVPKTWATAC
jgi:hypothetical protein